MEMDGGRETELVAVWREGLFATRQVRFRLRGAPSLAPLLHAVRCALRALLPPGTISPRCVLAPLPSPALLPAAFFWLSRALSALPAVLPAPPFFFFFLSSISLFHARFLGLLLASFRSQRHQRCSVSRSASAAFRSPAASPRFPLSMRVPPPAAAAPPPLPFHTARSLVSAVALPAISSALEERKRGKEREQRGKGRCRLDKAWRRLRAVSRWRWRWHCSETSA